MKKRIQLVVFAVMFLGSISFYQPAVGIALAVFAFLVTLHSRWRARRLEAMTPARVAELRPGAAVARGRVVAKGEQLTSPWAGKRCVHYHLKVEEMHRPRKVGAYWATLIDERRSIPWTLRDPSGEIGVDLDRARLELAADKHTRTGSWSDAPADVESILRARRPPSKCSGIDRLLRCAETVLGDGDEVFVTGTVVHDEGQGPRFTTGSEAFIVSDQGPEVAARSHRRLALRSAAAAVIFLMLVAVSLAINGWPKTARRATRAKTARAGAPAPPANRPPTIDRGPHQVREGRILFIDATDPDRGQSVRLTAEPVPANLHVVGGSIRFQPGAGQAGIHSLVVQATDDGSPPLSTTETLVIEVLAAEPFVRGQAERPELIEPVAERRLGEGDALALTLRLTPAAAGRQVRLVATLPKNASFDPETGLVVFQPDFEQYGIHKVELTAEAKGAPPLTETIRVSIAVEDRPLPAANRPPRLGLIGPRTVAVGSILAFETEAVDLDLGQRVRLASGGLPEGAAFDPETGAFRFEPSSAQAGKTYHVVFTATDDGTPPLGDGESVAIRVSELPPIAERPAPVERVIFASRPRYTSLGAGTEGDLLSWSFPSRLRAAPRDGSAPPIRIGARASESQDQPTVSPDRRWLLYSTLDAGSGPVPTAVDLETGDIFAIPVGGLSELSGAWHPREPRRLVAGHVIDDDGQARTRFALIDLRARSSRVVHHEPGTHFVCAFTPDGAAFHYLSGEGDAGGVRLHRFDLEREAASDLGQVAVRFPDPPAASPDGARLALVDRVDMSAPGRVHVVDLASRSVTPVSRPGAGLSIPQWSPDGLRIAFTMDGGPGEPGEVWICDADGSRPRRVSRNAFAAGTMAWSPDGRFLAYAHQDHADGQVDIFVADLSTDEVRTRNLTSSPESDELSPCWAPAR